MSRHRIHTTLPRGYFRLAFGSARKFARKVLAAHIILANERTQGILPPSRVQTESRKIRTTEKDLLEIRTGLSGRVQLPSEEEARYWLQQRCEAAKPKPKKEAPYGEDCHQEKRLDGLGFEGSLRKNRDAFRFTSSNWPVLKTAVAHREIVCRGFTVDASTPT